MRCKKEQTLSTMLKLGKKAQYALVALLHLDRVAPRGTRVCTRELSQCYGIPEQHLGKILQKLGRAGILRSAQGVQGGYELACPAGDLRLGDILDALEPGSHGRSREHKILTAFPACYLLGLTHEVERKVLDMIHNFQLNEILDSIDLPEIHIPIMEAAG